MHMNNDAYRYLLRKSDQHGTVVRDEIETKEGHLARLLLREDKPLEANEDDSEKERLQEFLKSPSDQKRKLKQSASNMKIADELIGVMPKAMLYTYRPGQPQLPGFSEPQIVIDYQPNPAWHPGSMAQSALTGLKGTFWVDRDTHHLLRMEGEIVRPVNLVFGLVAKIYPGGKLELEQRSYAPGRYLFTRFVMNLTLRELMVKTRVMSSSQEAFNVQALPDSTTLQQAGTLLLNSPQAPGKAH